MRRPAQLRRPAAIDAPTPKTAKSVSFPAPVGGWIKNVNLSTPGARMPDGSKVSGAYVLENHFPTATGVRMRRGSLAFAQVGDGTVDVVSMFSYVNGNNNKLFAATAAAVYDITSPPAAEDTFLIDDLGDFLDDQSGDLLYSPATSVAAALSGQTSGSWSAQQFATPGGVFLICVNGSDPLQIYDGSNFATTPVVTGVDPRSLSFVWQHQRRIFFVQKDSLNAWYLAADSIGGPAVQLPLGGVFPRGGSLLFGSSWSLETGAGLSEQCAFFSTEGEVAIYQGTDPSVASSWQKVGVYRIGKPLGAKSHVRAGGDVLVATDIGFLPLSVAIQRDYAALAPSAVSYQIETAWNDAVAGRSQADWSVEIWPTNQMVLVAPPTPTGETPNVFVSNARTGAWGLFTGWDVKCLQLFGDRLFFGSSGGLIVECEVTGADQGLPYTATCVPLFDFMKAPASLKTSLLMRQVLKAPTEIVPQMSLQVDYVTALPPAPDAVSVNSLSVWGGGVWGLSVWGGETELDVFARWQSVGGSGYAVAPSSQITSGSLVPPDVQLVRVDMTYDQGDIVS